MKKAFSTLISVIILTVFSALVVFIFEIKAIQSENIKNEYLQIQAQLHLDFLKHIVTQLNDDSIENLEFVEEPFTLKVESTSSHYELFVYAKQYNIAQHTRIIK